MPHALLVAVDFSDCGRRALDEAIRLAQDLRAPIRLVHVLPRPLEQTIGGGTVPWDMLEEITQTEEVEEARQLSQEWAGRVREADVEVETEVRPHPPAEGILAAVDEHQPTMVVIGTHGRSGLTKMVLGSVAHKVVQRCRVPVLVVPPGDE